MFGALYSSATALKAVEEQQRVIALNLSNLNTPGYRQQVVAFKSLLHEGLDERLPFPRNRGTQVSQIENDFTAGPLEPTGRELDFAIRGDGFFALESPRGLRYTRAGGFYVGQDGGLVAANGFPVMGENGPIQLPPSTTPDQVTVGQDGTLNVAGARVAKLRVVSFQNLGVLRGEGAAMFNAGKSPPIDANGTVHQGFRERSNVDATQQLIKLIAGVRHHEAAQRTLKSMSETLQERTRGR